MCPHTTTSAAGTSLTPMRSLFLVAYYIYTSIYVSHTTTSAAGTSLTPRANALVITRCVEVLSSFFLLFFSLPFCF